MSTTVASTDLVAHLCRQSALSPHEASRLVQEVLAFYGESADAFIRRRHYELQKSGLPNATIYALIGEELKHHRFVATPLSVRQIRRTIYG